MNRAAGWKIMSFRDSVKINSLISGGGEKNLDEVLQTDTVFVNVVRGEVAKVTDLKKVFNTDDRNKICLEILEKGEFQLSEKERQSALSNKFTEIANCISSMCINPTTERPYPVSMLEKAMKDAHISVNPNRSAKQQVTITDTSKQPIRTRYLLVISQSLFTGCQPIRDQYVLIRSVPGINNVAEHDFLTKKLLLFREKNLDEVLQTDTVFVNVVRGEVAKVTDLKKVFNTDDRNKICLEILEKGEFQLSEKERQSALSNKFTEIANCISSMCINPTTERPYPVSMLEKAMKDAHISVNPNRSAKQQVTITDTSKQPIRTRYLLVISQSLFTGCQPIRDQYVLIRSVPGYLYPSSERRTPSISLQQNSHVTSVPETAGVLPNSHGALSTRSHINKHQVISRTEVRGRDGQALEVLKTLKESIPIERVKMVVRVSMSQSDAKKCRDKIKAMYASITTEDNDGQFEIDPDHSFTTS
eukprot:sb/3464347/